jgi:phage antirepressor YoqD-like protein/phage anti-repressor protein
MEGFKYIQFNGQPVVSARDLYAFLTYGEGNNINAWLLHCKEHWMMERDADYFEVTTPGGHIDYLLVVTTAAVMCTGIRSERSKEAHAMIRLMITEIPDQLNSISPDDTSIDMNEAAKILGMGQKVLFRFLIERNILMTSNIPYQNFVNGGYFKVKRQEFHNHGRCHHYAKTFVTKSGLEWLAKIIDKNKQKVAA